MKKTRLTVAISLVLSLVLAFSSFSVIASAASATVIKQPNRTAYYQGIDWSYNKAGTISVIGSFDISGTALSYRGVTVEYAVDKWPNMYSKPDSGEWTLGNNKMRIYCDNFSSSAYAIIDVQLVAVESISIVTPPKKTNLIEDQDWNLSSIGDVEFTTFDLTGLKLKVKYTDGNTKYVSYPGNELIGWSVPQDLDYFEPGEATLYATFGGKSAPFSVNFLTKDTKLLGDVNGDYSINSFDALLILKYAVGQTTLDDDQKFKADVNKDSSINSNDALAVLQYSVGKITSFN